MSIFDIMLVLIIAVCILFGAYRGFLVSAFKTGSFFVSWVIAYILHPLVAWIFSGKGVIQTLINYTEGAAKLNLVSVEQIYLPVKDLPADTLNELVNSSNLVSPFNNLVKQNIVSQEFASRGLTTVGEYFDYTVAYATLNILAFIAVFILARVLLGVLINATDAVHHFPVLKHYDTLLGGVMGLLRGVFTCYVLVALLPIALSIFNVPAITQMVTQSPLCNFFYQSNFILLLMGGSVW